MVGPACPASGAPPPGQVLRTPIPGSVRGHLVPSAGATLVLALVAGGCASVHRSGPAAAITDYLAAIETDQPAAAYSLLSESLRKQITEQDFTVRWKSLRPELQAQAGPLRAALSKGLEARAAVVSASGVRALLAHREKQWQVEESPVGPLATRTPAETLKAFVRAVEERDFDAVMRLLAKPFRESVEKEINERISKLRQALDREIEVSGQRARLRYDPRFKLELINEDGQWKIVTID